MSDKQIEENILVGKPLIPSRTTQGFTMPVTYTSEAADKVAQNPSQEGKTTLAELQHTDGQSKDHGW